MERVSGHFNLGRSQSSLDFVDVYFTSDIPLFIDPSAINAIADDFSETCAYKIKTFFEEVVRAIREGDEARALNLLGYLSETNYTHLGYSSTSKGSGVGAGLAQAMYDQLITSRAVQTGLVEDLEETALMIPKWGSDRVSDAVTKIILEDLVSFTEACAGFYEIPVKKDVAIGYSWDDRRRDWVECRGNVPVEENPLILVPKSFVRRSIEADADTYYRHFVLDFLKRRAENDPRSSLGKIIKSGRDKGVRRVTKTEIEEGLRRKYGGGPDFQKRVNVGESEENPGILSAFRDEIKKNFSGPESSARLNESVVGEYHEPNYDSLLEDVLRINPGREESADYEAAIEALLSSLFYPSLINPRREHKIHEGRKRIDIAYTNAASEGFFGWMSRVAPAGHIYVECKNYSKPLKNEEFDQVGGRFSPSRGKVGILVYRKYEAKAAARERCRDTARDDRGFIIHLDDEDLKTLVSEQKAGSCANLDGLLYQQIEYLMG